MFRTKDLSLAAFLKMKGFTINEMENDKGVVHFCFDDSNEIQEAKRGFFNNEGGFNAFSNSLKDLKTMIHNQ